MIKRATPEQRWWDDPIESELEPIMLRNMATKYLHLYIASEDRYFLDSAWRLVDFARALTKIRDLETNKVFLRDNKPWWRRWL